MQVDRNFELLSKNHVHNYKEYKYQANVVNWLHSFTKTSENYGHEKDSIAKLRNFINYCEYSCDVNNSLACFTRDYILMYFEPQFRYLSFWHHKSLSMVHVDHNCFTESEKSALARDYGDPKSSYSIHVACDAINNHMSGR